MRNRSILAIIYVSVAFASGCSYFDKKQTENTQPLEAREAENEVEEDKNSGPTKLNKKFSSSVKIQVAWRKKFGSGLEEHYLKLRPSFQDGVLFISDRNGELITVDAASGKLKWKIEEKNVEYTSSAGVGDGLVLVGTGDGRVIAREAKSGNLKWIVRTSSEVLAPPTSSDGITVIRSADGSLVGIDSKTGLEIWNYRREAPRLTLRGNSRPLADDGILFSALDNGRLLALDLRLGRSIWDKAITVPSGVTDLERMVDLDGDPVLTKDFIYVSSYQGGVTALSKVDGQIVWARQISSHNGLTRGNGRIYAVDEDSSLWALDENDGISVWKQEELKRRSLTDPVFFKNYIVVGDFEGYIHWINADTGEIVFRTRLDKKGITAPPIVADDMVVVRSVSGKTIALKPNKS